MLPQLISVTSTNDYSTQHITAKLLSDITSTLKDLDYGSVEIFVVAGEVTQITKRHIRKTKHIPASKN